MAIIDINKPLQAGAVYIKGRTDPIKNCAVYILDNFVLIARDLNDTNPTWYNVSLIERLEEVKAEAYKTRIG